MELKLETAKSGLAGKSRAGRFLVIACLLIIAGLLMMTSPLSPGTDGDVNASSGAVKYHALLLLQGKMPYRDFFTYYGPVVLFYNVIGTLISRWSGIWVLECLSMLITLFLIYRISETVLPRFQALLPVLIVSMYLWLGLDGGNLSEEFALPFLSYIILIFVYRLQGKSVRPVQYVLFGVAVATLFFLQWDLVLLPLFCGIWEWIRCRRQRRGSCMHTIRYILTGALVITLPIILWLLIHGAFCPFLSDYLIHALRHPFLWSGTADDVMWKFLIPILGLGFSVALLFLLPAEAYSRYLELTLGIIVLFAVLLLTKQLYLHGLVLLAALMAFPCALSMKQLILGSSGQKILFSILIILPVVVIVARAQAISNTFDSDPLQAQAADIIDQETSEEDTILVYGDHDALYVRSDRDSSVLPSQELSEYGSPSMVVVYTSDLSESSASSLKAWLLSENYVLTEVLEGIGFYQKLDEQKEAHQITFSIDDETYQTDLVASGVDAMDLYPDYYWYTNSETTDPVDFSSLSDDCTVYGRLRSETYQVRVFRLYNTEGFHIYTISAEEKSELIAAGVNFEMVGWFAPEISQTPVYALFNEVTGRVRYSCDVEQIKSLEDEGWTNQGIAFYSNDALTTPVYCATSIPDYSGDTVYTTDFDEYKGLVDGGWTDQGVVFYGN